MHDAAAGSVETSACGISIHVPHPDCRKKSTAAYQRPRARRFKSGMVLHIDEGRVDPGHLIDWDGHVLAMYRMFLTAIDASKQMEALEKRPGKMSLYAGIMGTSGPHIWASVVWRGIDEYAAEIRAAAYSLAARRLDLAFIVTGALHSVHWWARIVCMHVGFPLVDAAQCSVNTKALVVLLTPTRLGCRGKSTPSYERNLCSKWRSFMPSPWPPWTRTARALAGTQKVKRLARLKKHRLGVVAAVVLYLVWIGPFNIR